MVHVHIIVETKNGSVSRKNRPEVLRYQHYAVILLIVYLINLACFLAMLMKDSIMDSDCIIDKFFHQAFQNNI